MYFMYLREVDGPAGSFDLWKFVENGEGRL